MRLLPLLMLPYLVCVASEAAGAEQFPYKAYIGANDVYVRSGPGQNYYPTDKLKAGEVVEVYRHDPGGWYAVRPPEGSFTWVSGRHLQWSAMAPKVPGVGTIKGDAVAARVGSRFSDIRDVIQVRLHDLEPVEVLEKVETGNGSSVWYKIAPPAGEFRWVFGKYVDPVDPSRGIRKPPNTDNAVSQGEVMAAVQPPSGAPAVLPGVSDPLQSTPLQGNPPQPIEPAPSAVAPSAPPATVFHPSEGDDSLYGMAVPRGMSPEEFQGELDRLGMSLSVMVAEEPTVWEFGTLQQSSDMLVNQAETALERGRARVLVNKIARFEDIKLRYDKVRRLRDETETSNRQLAQLMPKDRGDRLGSDMEGRFDGIGRLTRVKSSKLGAPRYALIDERGDVYCYVSPAPGVNLRYFEGSRVGINGTRGYMPQQRAHHVMAQHIRVLDGRQLR